MAKARSKQSVSRPHGRRKGLATHPDVVCDLPELRPGNGVAEERISEVILATRTYSESQTAEAAPLPAAPTPPAPESPEAIRAQAAEQEVIELQAKLELERAEKTRANETANKTAYLNGERAMLSRLEPTVLRVLPRPSHVGRALHDVKAFSKNAKIGYTHVYQHLASQKPKLLSKSLLKAAKSLAVRTRRKRSNNNSSALTKNMAFRYKFLSDRLGCAKHVKLRAVTVYWLTSKGQELFNGWPEWVAADHAASAAPRLRKQPLPMQPSPTQAPELPARPESYPPC